MNELTGHKVIIFGLGKSGISCARYFDRVGVLYTVVDTRRTPPNKNEVAELKNCLHSYFGEVNESILNGCEKLVVSPGIPLTHPLIIKARMMDINVCGDIDIFIEKCDKKLIAITGSNGKSTVTELTEELITSSGLVAQKAGNIGLPVLDYLENPQFPGEVDFFVLELSSFQLDITSNLNADVAVILNISEDHMDRYANFQEYINSKRSIFNGAKNKIFNLDDKNCIPATINDSDIGLTLLKSNGIKEFCLASLDLIDPKYGDYYLKVCDQNVVQSSKLKLVGKHNYFNILACLSVLKQISVKIDGEVINKLCGYQGMAHRFQLVSKKDNCDWINDSKATNVGATIAALNNFENKNEQSLVLIAGGDTKQSDLKPLIKPLEEKVSNIVLLGKDAKLIASLSNKVKSYFVSNMLQAVEKAKSLIENSRNPNKKSTVLLSPACSSLDMYKNFEERGEIFMKAVEAL